MFYVVVGGQVLRFEDGMEARTDPRGFVLHVIDGNKSIVGNVPLKNVRFYGPSLPEEFRRLLDRQQEEDKKWDAEKKEAQH